MIRTRFAPSPTGSMHIGNLRTAFYAYALAKHNKGDFILRIEDTDKKREKMGGVEDIKRLLKIFNIKWDEYYVQSQRLEIYNKIAKKLVSDGHAFYCQCDAKNAKEDGFSKVLRDPCRDKDLKTGAIKLKVPDKEKIEFTDYVLRKKISWDTSTVGDATLLKSDGFPTYHLAVVVDDNEMKISHALRGHDWMPSTPIHLLVYKYLGFTVPEIGHLTDIMDPDGGKLSKRKGSTSVDGLINEGYLPEALFNFVILLGWAPKDNKELFTLEEFVNLFDPLGFQKANPIFNRDKLDWFNGEYIRKISDSNLCKKFEIQNPDFKKMDKDKKIQITKLVKERIKKISDFDSLANFFFNEPKVDSKLFGIGYIKHIKSALLVLNNIESWDLETLNNDLMNEITKNNFKTGDFFMSLRISLTGTKFTPPINDSIIILGKEETIKRLNKIE
ncbi:MAG: glutamate--tRNA ligase [Candidatus Woesebacteria bacterium]|nr:glutamate--tRNA ligase [Candidatus Woesebacteria bacterium]